MSYKRRFEDMFNVSVTTNTSEQTWEQIFNMINRYESQYECQKPDSYDYLKNLHMDAQSISGELGWKILEMTSSLTFHPQRTN